MTQQVQQEQDQKTPQDSSTATEQPKRKPRIEKMAAWAIGGLLVLSAFQLMGGNDQQGESANQPQAPRSAAQSEQVAQAKPEAKQVEAEPAPTPKPAPKTFAVGQEAQLSDSAWNVYKAYPTTQLKDVFHIDPPKQGNFVVANFTFRNDGREAVTLDTMHMTLTDDQGRTYEPDTDTFSYIPTEKDIFLTQVNPGVTQDGMVIFTVAPDAQGFTFHGQDMDFWSDKEAKIDLGF